eukprot:CAMPEP_0202867984 /NCGR_PEP_ID=MMETSP1391-20130828/9934_1 /ASSEMBLY_ACC=CAM_ASM_000867 /TAXON_ID=1034604 /ORGANISM="Chlamydomonas leiostraca, Strain SAG 11-49" /LENGTH=98 /DNA_ID=CAMNT_0049548077 /DNA_START=106 /DNA_END=399 /DNA_ORIENTATION=+
MAELKVLVDFTKLEDCTTAPFSAMPVVVRSRLPMTWKQVVELLERHRIAPPHSQVYMQTSDGWELAEQECEIVDIVKLRVRVVTLPAAAAAQPPAAPP